MAKMEIVEKKTSELKAYENNPRANNDAIEPVMRSIEQFGFRVPIIIDRENVIVAGHTRLKAAKRLKLKTVPCLVADDLTEDQIKAYRLVDNKCSQYASWLDDLLKQEIASVTINLSHWDFPNLSDVPTLPDTPDVPKEIKYVQKWGIVVDFLEEEAAKKAFDLISGLGFDARIVSV